MSGSGEQASRPLLNEAADAEPGLVLIFDLDGTLVDSNRDIHNALSHALAAVDDGRRSSAADAEALHLGGHGLPLERFFQQARPTASPAGLSAFVAAYRAHYHCHLLDHTRPFDGVLDGLRQLAGLRAHHLDSAGQPRLRTAVATTKLTATAHKVIEGLELQPYFDVVLGSDGLPPKPDPAVLHAVLRRLGRRDPWHGPGETVYSTNPRARRPVADVMVGDTDYDILAGRAAGLLTCAVGWSELPQERLRAARPDYFISRFHEVVDLITRLAATLLA